MYFPHQTLKPNYGPASFSDNIGHFWKSNFLHLIVTYLQSASIRGNAVLG